MSENQTSLNFNEQTSVKSLRMQYGGTLPQEVVSDIYEFWRTNQLKVERSWNPELNDLESIKYSKSSCLLPDDLLTLVEIKAHGALKIATWNVNSIRVRMEMLLDWLKKQNPDVVCLQETKVEDHQFPEQELRDAGYNSIYMGQKNFNGVAILSRFPISESKYGFLNGFDRENNRLISGVVEGITFIDVYVPQGQTTDSQKFSYKLEFLNELVKDLAQRFKNDQPLVLLGDLNIAPDDRDVTSPEAMQGLVSFHPKEHEMLQKLRGWGLHDLFRKFNQEAHQFTWWDFRTRGFERNDGMRIDHLWVTSWVLKKAQSCVVDVENRSLPKPSDHAPVISVINL